MLLRAILRDAISFFFSGKITGKSSSWVIDQAIFKSVSHSACRRLKNIVFVK